VTGSASVTASARGATGYVFDHWDGCDSVSGTGNAECSVSVHDDMTVTAVFRDAQAPSVSLTSPSTGFKTGSIALSATATDNSGVARVEFRVRGALVNSDTSAPFSYSFPTGTVADGAATIRATAFDSVGNSTATEVGITIDNTFPSVAPAGPNGQTYGPGTTQSWTLNASDATSGVASVMCRIVSATSSPAFGACTVGSTSHSVSNLPGGAYTFEVKVVDNVGLTTTVSRTFTIDATPPNTRFKSGGVPPAKTTSSRATFKFASTEAGSTFQCKLDRGAWKNCNSGTKTYTGISRGTHTFRVRAIDAFGNKDGTPAVRTWKRI
jgi:hypothetical protein